jgi:DNA-binding LacI/PurR family transcriptional regulator
MTKSPPIKKSATIRDVARLAGVSVATISRYLNNHALLAEETASRVKLAMETLNYTPDMTARNLATRRTYTIGFLTDSIKGVYMTPLLEGIENAARSEGYNLMISTYAEDGMGRKQLPLGRHNVDGLLIFSGTLNRHELLQLNHREMPFVLIHQTPPEDVQAPSVTIENKAASKRLVDHLIEIHGCRRILHLHGLKEQEDAAWRELGYVESLRQHGIPVEPGLIIPGLFERQIACQSLKTFIQSGEKFDAVFAADDESAVGVYMALQEAELRIPEDVRVVGFDNQIFTPYLVPALTTVHAPTADVGKMAVQKLFKLMRTGEVDPVELLPTDLVIRQSCGCGMVA